VYYNFDQFLWSPRGDPTRGIGVFFRFGVSDGVANPVKYAYNVGIGGKGIAPGRPDDSFGIGWSGMNLSDKFFPFLRERLRSGPDSRDASRCITTWRSRGGSTRPPTFRSSSSAQEDARFVRALRDMDTAVVAGLRLYVRF